MDVQDYIKQWEQDKKDRHTTESEWQDIADYTFPRRDFTTERAKGDNRRRKIFDSIGIKATLMLASAMHANMTPVNTRWFYLNPGKDDKEYWEMAQNHLLNIYASPSSRFALQAHELYLDLVAFGTSVMGVFEQDGRSLFKTLNMADCWIRENQNGVVDHLKYCQEYTSGQMIDTFGEENVHENVKKAHEKNDNATKFKVLNCVGPRYGNAKRGAVVEQKPFYSVYIDIANKHQIGPEGGYDDFPYLVPRLSKRSGETYGYGCGGQAISEVKMLNQIVEVMFRAASKNADPPVLSPIDGVVLPMRLDPGGINYYNPDVGPPEFWNNNFRPDYMDFIIKEKRADIEKIYFIDWLTLPDNDRMTATETMQRAQDSFKNMSAINARVESEFLSQLIRRTYLVEVSAGRLEKPPKSSQGKDIRIEYTSPVALAQKSISANAVLQAMGLMGQIAQFDQTVINRLDGHEVIKDQFANTYFLPESYILDDDELEEKQERQQAAQASQMLSQNPQGFGSAVKDVADAVTTLQGE